VWFPFGFSVLLKLAITSSHRNITLTHSRETMTSFAWDWPELFLACVYLSIFGVHFQPMWIVFKPAIVYCAFANENILILIFKQTNLYCNGRIYLAIVISQRILLPRFLFATDWSKSEKSAWADFCFKSLFIFISTASTVVISTF